MCFSRSTASGQEIAELERRMRVNDMIIRYITVRVDEDRKKATKMQAKREARAAKRAKFRPDRRDGGDSRRTAAGITEEKYGRK